MYSDYNMYNPFNNYKNTASNVTNDEIITLNQAIELIKKSVGAEKEDEIFYNQLIQNAPTEQDKNIIISIRNDEVKHNQILRNLYYEFTGQNLLESNISTIPNPNMPYKEQLKKALFGELDAVIKYRKILGTMPSGNSYTLLMSIMTDEIRHAIKYNYLLQNLK